ncbi:hypothetical protein GQ55_5G032200 [Panicum hallii var. hallii]|uniref:Uncharacterized protein n=1 Tax=Panicum hallii var. hallii TaxID=1504633 RepID=A0A2T7DC65_9POAL|nr:hypothetical protein GQ55_5G032200 [Panicum hallii var. hallii]
MRPATLVYAVRVYTVYARGAVVLPARRRGVRLERERDRPQQGHSQTSRSACLRAHDASSSPVAVAASGGEERRGPARARARAGVRHGATTCRRLSLRHRPPCPPRLSPLSGDLLARCSGHTTLVSHQDLPTVFLQLFFLLTCCFRRPDSRNGFPRLSFVLSLCLCLL